MARFEIADGQAGTGALGMDSSEALYELGLSYATGRGRACDLIQAHKWFNLSALRGNDAAKRYRAEISAELSKAEIAVAQRMAREWLSSNR